MSVYQAVDGTVVAVSHEFMDDNGTPLLPAAGYPKVRLENKEKELLSSTTAAASQTEGVWNGNLSIPNMGLKEKTEFRIRWRFLDRDGNKHMSTEAILIEPAIDRREGDVVAMMEDEDCVVVLPVTYEPAAGWTGDYQIYRRNEKVLANSVDLDFALLKNGIDQSSFTIMLDEIPEPALDSYLLSMRVTPPSGRQRTYNHKLWVITPQIALGMSHLEDFINKSRIENVIPELQWTDADLLTYLERGLYMFNRVGYPTGFNGTNMQGQLFDAWLICSCYYALGAQLQAEGSLAFDFSGQGVSLNVDRTPQLDSALGRVESQIDQHVLPLKKQLNSNGLTQGDGSVGSTNLNNPYAKGRLSIINAPTTRLPYFSSTFTGKRGWRSG